MRLTSWGAAETVTGSAHLLEVGGQRVLVDCGLFQGGLDAEALNREPLGFDPASVDAALLTHAHLDHLGRLPLLVAGGFRGRIHCSGPTARVAEVVLLDSARVQQEDHAREQRRSHRRVGSAPPEGPLYDEALVRETLRRLTPDMTPHQPRRFGRVTVTARPAGHILGSVFYEVEAPEGRAVLSGDLGNCNSALQPDFTLPFACDAAVVETTYADRTHRSLADTVAEFRDVLRRSLRLGGAVIIPSFALERAQNLLYFLGRLMDAGEIPAVPVFLDSPMAAQVTRLYREYASEFESGVAGALSRGEDPFHPPGLRVLGSPGESRALNARSGPMVILAGSGMTNGGRVRHHLRHRLGRPETSVVIVSFQAPGTLGAELIGGARQVRLFGEEVPVRASIHTIGGFSAHADRDDLLAWLEPTGAARVLLVHGERPTMEAFGHDLAARGRAVQILRRGEPLDLGGGEPQRSAPPAGGRPEGKRPQGRFPGLRVHLHGPHGQERHRRPRSPRESGSAPCPGHARRRLRKPAEPRDARTSWTPCRGGAKGTGSSGGSGRGPAATGRGGGAPSASSSSGNSWASGSGVSASSCTLALPAAQHSSLPHASPEGQACATRSNLSIAFTAPGALASITPATTTLFTAPFHALGMLQPTQTSVGIGTFTQLDASGRYARMGSGITSLKEGISAGAAPLTFPGNGATTDLVQRF
ncbi:MBL fold metallo-hydrolase RNA specificity domain-containing protein [Deinococcus sp. NW-56]|uniref:MBL fold metallo-hydrolase RNA specificity domain-containing protein n=1 Tax=Deinococcus sp. NW-56 TaxID=2080419 RepID=UPI000CF50977|nr:MBL fold metallo-hydrolase [Deinococcus sp. NW-56]